MRNIFFTINILELKNELGIQQILYFLNYVLFLDYKILTYLNEVSESYCKQ